MNSNDQNPDQYFNARNISYMAQSGIPVQCYMNQQGNPVYYQAVPSDKNFQGQYYVNPVVINQQPVNQVFMTPETIPQEMQPQNIHLQHVNIPQPISIYPTGTEVSGMAAPLSFRAQSEQSVYNNAIRTSINAGQIYAQNKVVPQPRNVQTPQTRNVQTPQPRNVQTPQPRNVPTPQPRSMHPPQPRNVQTPLPETNQDSGPAVIQHLFRNVIEFAVKNGASIPLAKSLICQYLSNKMQPDVFISTLSARKIYAFSAEQQKLLFEYHLKMNPTRTEDHTKQSFKNVQQVKQNINTHTNAPTIQQGRQIVPTSIPKQNNISSTQVAPQPRIPQLTMVQNQRLNLQTNVGLVERSGHGPVNRKDLREQNEANLGLTKDKDQEQRPDFEEEEDFEICGINIKEEEKLSHRMEIYTQMKPCNQKIRFDHSQIHSILNETCEKYKLSISPESAETLAMTLSIGLEVKLRSILQRATLFVHHRLRNFDVKGQKCPGKNIEHQVEFLEEVIGARDPKKSDRSKTKTKDQEKKQRQQEESLSRSNDILMAAMKGGRKIENFSQMIPNETKSGLLPSGDSSIHQRMRYSAQKQRKIFKRDLVQILKKEPNFNKHFSFQ
ncbi:hypothetical protein RF11_06823 [Thelohanellus kitauei]|uniref:Transcription initiation factor TFIID subunit 4 n=1 Tax=Thelohanellus kitauei TaxID=669202 RepID=A0A0C2MMB7_THEKT|nr:hypothetical protein RF11_06823 [Thelohanellus kitauei]